MNLTRIHIPPSYLLYPTNPITVNVIGAGGTGSHVIAALARLNSTLYELNHPGMHVHLYDDDTVSQTNVNRQLFTKAEIGLNKAVALINRYNRAHGSAWRAKPVRYSPTTINTTKSEHFSNITISCVDRPEERFTIAAMLSLQPKNFSHINYPYYWMDFGNSRFTGQVILSTVHPIKQPQLDNLDTIDYLPKITEEFPNLLQQSTQDTTPGCSTAEALLQQDLFINSSLAQLGCSLLSQMIQGGQTLNRGLFHNLKTMITSPLTV